MTRIDVPVQLRWADLDAYGHVNNAQMLQLLEEARIEAFWSHPGAGDATGRPSAVIDAGLGAQTTTLVARQEIEYLRPLDYRRAPVVVQLWIGHLGGASIDVCYVVHDGVPDAESEPYARATTTLVLVDTATGRPRRITDTERAAWSPFLGEPVAMRRRRAAEA
ncbi:acyl-CoA thioesterase [Cellulomonas aerilata]|uniref:Thioesterase n=1 Tax=Cellulomonas aerilata TaxID=515326 RepID=A0A512DC55_9CELL|nr:thioesterase family protein [Cellulomonas aerilata]GEO34035.1 thioesterase [Cellulomonas aerilata]